MSTTVIRNTRDISPVLRRQRTFPAAVQKVMTQAMRRATFTLEAEAAKRTPVGVGDSATGHLRASITSEVRGTPARVRGIVGSPSDYGLAVELGSRPHWPPKGVMKRWAQLKLGLSEKKAGEIEYVLRRSISRKGTPAVKMFTTAFSASRSRIDTFFTAAMRRVARKHFGSGSPER